MGVWDVVGILLEGGIDLVERGLEVGR